MWKRAGGGEYNQTRGGGAPSRFGQQQQQQQPQAGDGGRAASALEEEQRSRARYLAASRAKFKKGGYFDDDDDDEFGEEEGEVEEQPVEEEDDEVDPLDAFMAGVDTSLKKEPPKKARPERLDDLAREEGDAALADAQRGEKRAQGRDEDEVVGELEGVSYRDGRAVVSEELSKKNKRITALEPVNHKKNYEAVPTCLIEGGVERWNSLAVGSTDGGGFVAGGGSGVAPRRAASFAEMFGEACPRASWLLKPIAKYGLEAPTAVQALAVPAALCGRDVLALAETGSGKTLAYGWPALAHAAAQRPSEGKGPLVLILCPTRELSEQIYREVTKFAKYAPKREGCDLGTVAIFGGGGKYEMGKALSKRGADIAVATPGRLIELISEGKTELQSRCTFLVVDEADRMFEMGFIEQLRSIVQHVRPGRQTMLTSATLASKLEGLVRSTLKDPVRVVVGCAGGSNVANDAVLQSAVVLPTPAYKWGWLAQNLTSCFTGRCIIFVGQKKHVDELAKNLALHFPHLKVSALHGDMDAHARQTSLLQFRKHGGLLVATDVAARGLDIRDVGTVVNFDAPKSLQEYIHRVGRTGRTQSDGEINADGQAFTLLTADSEDDKIFGKRLYESLRQSKRSRPGPELAKLAGIKGTIQAPSSSGNNNSAPLYASDTVASVTTGQTTRGLGAEIPPPPLNMAFAPPGQQQAAGGLSAAELIAQFNSAPRGAARAALGAAPTPLAPNLQMGGLSAAELIAQFNSAPRGGFNQPDVAPPPPPPPPPAPLPMNNSNAPPVRPSNAPPVRPTAPGEPTKKKSRFDSS